MKAIVYNQYGPPEVLQQIELEKSVPKDNEVLVKIYSTSINPLDWHYLRGKPYFIRLMGSGLLKPKNKILGVDIAGQVEVVGKNVKKFQVGDAVFGACKFGGLAEYVCAPETALQLKPDNISFDEGASVAVAAITAIQSLRNKGKIHPGQKVLINGAGGGVGTFAVQIAKSFGAEVTGVCSPSKLDLARSIGADHVIDYTQEDFTQNGQHYDIILDTAAFRSVIDYKRSLSPKGIYVMIGGSLSKMFQVIFVGLWVSLTSGKKMGFMIAKIKEEDMIFIKKLLESGKVVPVIDRRYALNEAPEAIRYLEKGHAKGKIIIQLHKA